MKGIEVRLKHLITDQEELAELEALVAATPEVELEVKPVHGVVGTAFLVILAGAGALAAWEHFAEKRSGGQVIDLRPDAKKPFYRDMGLQYGLIAIIAIDGKVTVEVKKPKGIFQELFESILSSVQDLATKSVKSVADAAKGVAGDQANVTTEFEAPRQP